MQLPPAVRLPGHPSQAGNLLAWRRSRKGEWTALVEIVEVLPGWTGGMQAPREAVFLAHDVEAIPGEDYSRVPRIYE
ncbi:hypothetical protein [Nonomuraea sp. NPDC023979]|uniref:hypothetical protein n=1 Tax=Nonomuraea sp. NPDC023979 TaxID=3154796 RepID=UPI0033E62919